MLTIKRFAMCSTRGGSLGMYITFASAMQHIRQNHSGFEIQRRHHQKSKTGVPVAPKYEICPTKKENEWKFNFKKTQKIASGWFYLIQLQNVDGHYSSGPNELAICNIAEHLHNSFKAPMPPSLCSTHVLLNQITLPTNFCAWTKPLLKLCIKKLCMKHNFYRKTLKTTFWYILHSM